MKINILIIIHLLTSYVFSCSTPVKTLVLTRIDNGYILHLNSGIISQYFNNDEDYSKIIDFSITGFKTQSLCDTTQLQRAFKVNYNIDSTLRDLSKWQAENINHQDVYISNFKNDKIDSIHINLLIKNLNPSRIIITKGKQILDILSSKVIGSMDDEVNPNQICGFLGHHPRFLKSTGQICDNEPSPNNHTELINHQIQRLKSKIAENDSPVIKEYFQEQLDKVLDTNN